MTDLQEVSVLFMAFEDDVIQGVSPQNLINLSFIFFTWGCVSACADLQQSQFSRVILLNAPRTYI